MIVTCPKCGFSQPKDRYCANCGVDMSLYRKAELPYWQRLLQNWVFQATVLVIALAAIFFGLRLQQKLSTHDADSQFSEARRATVIATQAVPIEPAQPRATPRLAATPVTLAAASAPTPTPSASATATPASPIVTQVGVVYGELPRAAFNDLVIDARGANTEGPFTTGILPDYEAKVKAAHLNILDSQAAQAVQINQPLVFFKGVRDPNTGANLGLTAQVTPSVSDDQGLHVIVDVQRTLRENGGTAPSEQSFQFEFVIPKGAAGFVSGLLPHRPFDESERALYRTSRVLSVMGSPDYQQGQSEFVIFFQAH